MPVEIQTIAHFIPTTQAVLDDQEAARRAVDRTCRREGRLEQLRRWRRGTPTLLGAFSTPATLDAIEHGVRADSEEWTALLEAEVLRVVRQVSDRRRYATKVLDRYERWLQATRERRLAAERAERAGERMVTEITPLTLERLIDVLDISGAFALHLVQPYCTCEPEHYEPGWDRCDHARDEGMEP